MNIFENNVCFFKRIDFELVLDGKDMVELTQKGLDRAIHIFSSDLRPSDGISNLPGGGVIFRAYSNNRARNIADHLVRAGLTQEHVEPLHKTSTHSARRR